MRFTYTYTKQKVRDDEAVGNVQVEAITMNEKQIRMTLLSLYREGFKKDSIVVEFIEQLLGLLEEDESEGSKLEAAFNKRRLDQDIDTDLVGFKDTRTFEEKWNGKGFGYTGDE